VLSTARRAGRLAICTTGARHLHARDTIRGGRAARNLGRLLQFAFVRNPWDRLDGPGSTCASRSRAERLLPLRARELRHVRVVS
jgi:hypothetical protein